MKEMLRSSAFVKKDDDGSITYVFTTLNINNGLAVHYQIKKNDRGQTRVYSHTSATQKKSITEHIRTLQEIEETVVKSGYKRISEKDAEEIKNFTSSNRMDEAFMNASFYLPLNSDAVVKAQTVSAQKIKLLKKIPVKPRGPR